MNIILAPVLDCGEIHVIKSGKSLIVNGEVYDFSRMTEGSTLPRGAVQGDHFPGIVEMDGGVITLTLRLPIPSNYSQAQAFPEPLINAPDGPLALPESLPVIYDPEFDEGDVSDE